MAWCLKPSLATLSSVPDRLNSSRYLSVFANSWPSDPDAYELTRCIGRGSSAKVYQAQCQELQATVAVKKLDLDGPCCDLGALIREAALLRHFQHQNVLLLYTSFVVGRELYMVMPYMDLGSVRSIMRKAFPQGLDEVLIATIMKSTLQALEYVHRNGGIHRDIKADNILVNSSGEVRLADFGVASDHCCGSNGLSRILERVFGNTDSGGSSDKDPSNSSSSSSSSSGGSDVCEACSSKDQHPSSADCHEALLSLRANTFVGTPCWMAPEVMQQLDEGYGNAADIWSAGITLIEMATGRPPLARCHPMRVLVDTVNCPPPSLPPDDGSKRFSKALRDIVALCLQKDPSKRPSAAELLQHRFFKAARDAPFLSNALLSALLPAQQPYHLSSNGAPAASDATAARAGSAPGQMTLGSRQQSINLQAASSRKIHSEPLMARLRSALGFGVGSFLGVRAARSMHSLSEEGCGRERSRWQFAAAAVGLSRATGNRCSVGAGGAAGLEVRAPPAAESVRTSSAAGSLSRQGSRGVRPYRAAEGTKLGCYAE